jgi:hypothetical protein
MRIHREGARLSMFRKIRYPLVIMRHLIGRASIVYRFVRAIHNAKDYEAKLQSVRQAHNDLVALGKEEDALIADGYCRALEDMLNGKY